jgi:hypothetical protein
LVSLADPQKTSNARDFGTFCNTGRSGNRDGGLAADLQNALNPRSSAGEDVGVKDFGVGDGERLTDIVQELHLSDSTESSLLTDKGKVGAVIKLRDIREGWGGVTAPMVEAPPPVS